MNKQLKYLAVGALALFGAVAVACGGDDDDAGPDAAASGSANVDVAAILAQVPVPEASAPAGSRVFVGHDAANNVSVGLIVFADSSVAAYECDGEQAWTWYAGSADGDELTLTSADGGVLTATIDGDSVTGEGSVAFSLEAATDRAGLYRVAYNEGGDTGTAGWVQQNDGTVIGGVSANIAGSTVRIAANFDPNNLAQIEALPEFPEIKAAIPGWPTIPSDVTVFAGKTTGACRVITGKLLRESISGSTLVPDTVGNRARLGLLGRFGCAADGFFGLAS